MKLQQSIAAILLTFEWLPLVAYGQISTQSFNPISSEANGIHLYSATVSSQYSSNAYGLGLVGLAQTGSNASTPVSMIEGSVDLGWARRGVKSNASVTYSPSYLRSVTGYEYNSLNHSLAASLSRSFGPKWTLGGSATGMVNDFQQLLFAQSQYGNLSAIQSTFDELVGAMLTGRSTNAALAQAVNAAPVVNSPETAFLYGGRLFSTSANLSLSYAYSSRSSFTAAIQGNRTQNLRTGDDVSGSTPRSAVPYTSAANASLGWSYSLTPRTTMGVEVSETRSRSAFQDAYTQRASISIGRTISTRWFVQVMGGAGTIRPIRQTLNPTRDLQPQFGGSVGYKLYAHTFLASYNRSISDMYAVGANTTDVSGGGWTWKRPGRGISLSGNFGYLRLIGPGFPTPGSWSAQAGVSRAMRDHLVMSVSGSYVQYPRTIFVAGPRVTQTGVSVSFNWSPSGRR